MPLNITLDPSEVAVARTQQPLTPWVGGAVDWGDAETSAYMAEAARGNLPVDYRLPNRTIQIPLVLRRRGGLTFDQIRTKVQAKVGLFQQSGGWLKRSTALGDVFADVVGAKLHLGGKGYMEGTRLLDVDAVLELTCLPEWYQAEIDLGTTSETTLPEVRKTMATVKGNYPGRVRVIVTEDQAVLQNGLIWGMRSRNYSAASTAALAYEAEALTLMDLASIVGYGGLSGGTTQSSTATTVNASNQLTLVTPTTGWINNNSAVSGAGIPAGTYIIAGAGTATMTMSNNATAGASGVAITGVTSNAVTHNSLASVWTPVLSTVISSGTLSMTHVGTYRVWARCLTTTAAEVRFAWDVGDTVSPVVNDPVTIPGINVSYDLDLGEVRLDPPPIGTHRWQGIVQGRAIGTGKQLIIDRLWFVPCDDGYGVLRSVVTGEQSVTPSSALDTFDQTAGNLTGKTAPIGGVWAGAGDADDFVVVLPDHTATRIATGDAASWVTGARQATLPVSMTTGVVQVRCYVLTPISNTGFAVAAGVIFRYVNSSNYLLAVMEQYHYLVPGTINVIKVVGGVATVLGASSIAGSSTSDMATLRLMVDAAGSWNFWFAPPLSPLPAKPSLSGNDSVLATGGVLASGNPGIVDWYPGGAFLVPSRGFDNFQAWVPTLDAVLYGSQNAELRTEGMFRHNVGPSAGTVRQVVGSLPRLPPSGLEGRTVEVFVKATRGLDNVPDAGIDDASVQVIYRPSWLHVPE